jgi:hypothetical protein
MKHNDPKVVPHISLNVTIKLKLEISLKHEVEKTPKKNPYYSRVELSNTSKQMKETQNITKYKRILFGNEHVMTNLTSIII